MKKEANKYSESERPDLLEAAETWRLPYWDWALKKQLPESPGEQDYNVPLVVLEKRVHIRQPTILGHGFCENAFYQFTMPEDLTMGDSSLGKYEKPLEDLRIHSKTWTTIDNAKHTVPVRPRHFFTRKSLIFFSLIYAKLQVDMQSEKATIETGLTGSKITQQLPNFSETTSGILSRTLKPRTACMEI